MGLKLQPLCLAIIALILCITNAFEECTTPHFLRGKCVSNDDCPAHMQIMHGPKPIQSRAQEYLNKSNCHGVSDSSTCCLYPKVKVTPPSASVSILPSRSECGDVIVDRIYNEFATEIDDYPWLALIEYKTKKNTTLLGCAGSLISSKYVLTGAHCVYGNVYYIAAAGAPTHIRLGEHDKTTNPDCANQFIGMNCKDKYASIPIENIIVHPDYDTSISQMNDIAIIRMSKEAPQSGFIKPICLPEHDVTIGKPDDEFLLTGVGWGRQSDVRLQFFVKYRTHDSCQKALGRFHGKTTPNQICVGGHRDNSSCKMDAGGPLMHIKDAKAELVGIHSFGVTPCTLGIPDVFTKVHHYLDWIKSQLTL